MTPLVLIVGFLGSGKTTFLKNLLPRLVSHNLKPSVIINDYQNARVDAEQLRGLANDIAAISGDCVCCGSRDELIEALKRFQHRPGGIAIIETNGTTDSELLIESLSLDPNLHRFSLPIQLSVIDAKRWQKRFWNNPLEREQARTATHVFVSRSDMVEPERLNKVEQTLQKTAPAPSISVDGFAAELAAVATRIQDMPPRHSHCDHHDCNHEHGHHDEHDQGTHGHAHHHFASLELPLPESVSKKAFKVFLKSLPKEVIRAKGIVRFEEEPKELYVFQRVDGFETPHFFSLGANPQIATPLILFIGPLLSEPLLQEAVMKMTL